MRRIMPLYVACFMFAVIFLIMGSAMLYEEFRVSSKKWHYLENPDALTDEQYYEIQDRIIESNFPVENTGISDSFYDELPDELRALYSKEAR